jgi:F0F1-type ATP synthase membrane subunit c/vacuolar-type H+-ATPase subunit K
VTDASGRRPPEEQASDRTRLYLGVVLVETIVILALWAFGRYFGS